MSMMKSSANIRACVRSLSIVILCCTLATAAAAELPALPDDWQLVGEGPCTVNSHPGSRGYCQVFRDNDEQVFQIFFDAPRRILFIRRIVSAEDNGTFEYLYGQPPTKVGELV
jgi:hypothetical protein